MDRIKENKRSLDYSDIKDAARENKTILIKKGSVSSFVLCDIWSALGSIGKNVNNFRMRNWGNGNYQVVNGNGIIWGVKIRITDKIKEEEFAFV